ncbi:MAG: peptidase [Acidobacteriales bacterium]|nr:peptidase [Terriglobales bacterium]
MYRFFLISSFVIAMSLSTLAQEPAAKPGWTPQELADMQKLQQAALHSDYGYEKLAYLTDSIGPRLSGSPQHTAAAEYVAAEMRKLGLDVHLEAATVHHWIRGEERGELTTYPGQPQSLPQKIVLTALGGSSATSASGLTAPIVVVSTFKHLEALGRDQVAGKIVLFNAVYDKRLAAAGFALEAYGQAVAYRGGGPSAASKLGAIGVLVRSVGNADYRLPHTGQTRYDPKYPAIPAAAITAEDADLIARLAARGPVQMHLLLTPQTLPDTTGYNVIADLKGSEHPEQIVIVSGHLDSWDLGTGALDDGAGVAVSMETLNLIKQLKLRPKKTIRFIAWVEEESGSGGARAYYKNHAADMANHFAAVETDLGAGHPMGIFSDGSPAILPILQPVSEILQSQGAGMIKITDEAGADLVLLNIAGVPGFAPIQDSRKYFEYHHTAADTLDKVDPQELRENSSAIAVLTYALANMSQSLPRTAKPLPDWMK